MHAAGARLESVYAGRERFAASRYRSTSESVLLERQGLDRALARAFRDLGWDALEHCRILDLGAGNGNLLLRLLTLGARAGNLVGVDLLRSRLRDGLERCPSLSLALADGCRLPFRDAVFDVATLCTVMSSVLEEGRRRAIASEVRRVTRPGGAALWYDMRITRPDNPNVRPAGHREASRYHPDCDVKSRTLTLAPVLSRPIAPLSSWAADALSRVPVLCGHRLTVIRFPRRAG